MRLTEAPIFLDVPRHQRSGEVVGLPLRQHRQRRHHRLAPEQELSVSAAADHHAETGVDAQGEEGLVGQHARADPDELARRHHARQLTCAPQSETARERERARVRETRRGCNQEAIKG